MQPPWRAFLAPCVLLGSFGPLRADEQAEMRAVIDKAIKAAGGEEKLCKFKAATWKSRGKLYRGNNSIDFTSESSVQGPEHSRAALELEFNNRKVSRLTVINGDKGWVKINDAEARVLNNEQLAEQQEELHHNWVARLISLKDKAFQLTPLGELKINDRPAVGVQVSYKGRRDVNLYFDKENGLLVKSETRVKIRQRKEEMTQETFYSDYKEIDGVQVPRKLVVRRDEKPYMEVEITEYELQEKLEDSLFDKP